MKLTKHMIEINGMKYFRGNAHMVNLGTCGEKKDPIGARAYIDPERDINRDKIEAYIKDQNYAVEIDFSQFSKTNVEANGKVKVFGIKLSGGTSFNYSNLKTASLSLLNFHLNESQLKTLINRNRSVFNYMKNEGRDARVVSGIWVVVHASLAQAIEYNGAMNVDARFTKNNELNVKMRLSGNKSHTITINSGSVFAYKMHKVRDFDRRRKNATIVTDLEADYKGMG